MKKKNPSDEALLREALEQLKLQSIRDTQVVANCQQRLRKLEDDYNSVVDKVTVTLKNHEKVVDSAIRSLIHECTDAYKKDLEAQSNSFRHILHAASQTLGVGEKVTNEKLSVRERRINNQRRQLREISEKLEAMKTWRGIFRTAGQRLGICR